MKKRIFFFALLISVFITLGCNNEEEGVTLIATTDTPLFGTVSSLHNPNISGDGDADFKDAFLTPLSFKAALKSARLIKSGDISPSYTIFDTETISNPIVASLLTGMQQIIGSNNNFPQAATYDRVVLEISFLELTIPDCGNLLTSCVNNGRRMRYYLSSFVDPILGVEIKGREILIESPPRKGIFNWIKLDSSQLNPFEIIDTLKTDRGRFFPITPPITVRPSNPLVIPISQFTRLGFPDPLPSTFTWTINLAAPLEIGSEVSGLKKVILKFDLEGILFFDDTNSSSTFDPFVGICPPDCDGRLDSMSLLGKPSADFYPGMPNISATVE